MVPLVLGPLEVVVGRLGGLDAREDFLVLARDALELALPSLAVERLRVLARVLADVHGLVAHDVRHLLEEQAVVALDLGVALLHHLLLFGVAALAALARVRLLRVDGGLHLPELLLVALLLRLDEARVAGLVADGHGAPGAVHGGLSLTSASPTGDLLEARGVFCRGGSSTGLALGSGSGRTATGAVLPFVWSASLERPAAAGGAARGSSRRTRLRN